MPPSDDNADKYAGEKSDYAGGESKKQDLPGKKMSGFLSFLFGTIIFVVTFAFAIGYMFKGTYHGYLTAMYWGFASFIFAGVAIFTGYQYFVLAPAKLADSEPELHKERPYVFVKETALEEPLTSGKKPIFTFLIANGGPVEAKCFVKDFTFAFTVDPEEYSFSYQAGDSLNFELAPTDQKTGRMNMELVMTEERIKALNNGRARFFIYARGEYSDEFGRKYPLKLCYMYNKDVGGNLVLCPGNIEIK